MLAAMVLMAASASHGALASLAAETFRVPPHDYRYVPARIANWPASLIGTVEVTGGSPLTLDVLSQRELTRFVRGEKPEVILSMADRRQFAFSQQLPDKGEYATVLINDGDAISDVQFEESVEFAREADVARYLSPGRRLGVILVSLLVFVGMISWSGVRLMGVMRRG